MPSDLDKSYGGYSTFKPMRHGENDTDRSSGGDFYRKLSDAAAVTGIPAYAGRGTKIWYWKDKHGRDLLMGTKFLKKQGLALPTLKTLSQTHVLIGEIGETNKSKVFRMMQGEAWSPQGEANRIISKAGVGHTSMSVGDIIMQGGKIWMVDRMGFTELES